MCVYIFIYVCVRVRAAGIARLWSQRHSEALPASKDIACLYELCGVLELGNYDRFRWKWVRFEEGISKDLVKKIKIL